MFYCYFNLRFLLYLNLLSVNIPSYQSWYFQVLNHDKQCYFSVSILNRLTLIQCKIDFHHCLKGRFILSYQTYLNHRQYLVKNVLHNYLCRYYIVLLLVGNLLILKRLFLGLYFIGYYVLEFLLLLLIS